MESERNLGMTVNTKRYLAAALCAVMLLEGLTGCGKKPPVKAETTAPSASETTQPTVPATMPEDGNPGDVTCKGSYTADSVNASAVVATVGNEQLTNGQLQVYYWMEVASYRQAAHETAPDFDKPLDTQPCEIDASVASWQQYFLKRALNSWHSALALSLQSVDEGIPTEEAYQPNMKNHETYMSGKPATAYLYGYNKNYRLNTLHEQYLEDIPQVLAALAEKYGFADVSALAKDIAGASAEDLTACMELYNRGYMYDTALSYYIAPTEEEVEAYFTEHESDYAETGITRSSGKLVDIRHILLIPQVPEDGTGTVTVAPDGTVTCSEDLWDACLASAQTLVEDYEKALAADSRRGDNRSTNDAIFADLANKNSADAGSALDGGLYQKLHKGQLTPVLDDWCFDDARQSGDVDILRSGLGYHIVFFKSSTDIWYDAAREDLTAALGGEKIAQAREKYPAEIDYSAITLGTAAQTAPVTASDLLYPDVGHQRYPEAQLYLQQDYPTTMYGAYRIVTHGCGITTMAMLATYMADTELTPPEMCRRYGGYCYDHGTDGSLFVVAPAQMGLLMRQHGDSGSFVQIRGQVNFGVHDAQDEGGADGVAAVHPLSGGGGKPHLPGKAEVADGGIQQHGCNAQPPRQGNQTCRRECRSGSFCGGERIGSEGSGADPIHLPGVQGLGNLLGSGSGLGHHAHPALKGEGERQPNGNQPPQQTGKAAGCLFQQRAQRQQNENHPSGGKTQPDNLPKEGKTHKGFSFPYSSSIRRMSLTSWGESFFPEAKAEIKAGREPWKVSSTNR